MAAPASGSSEYAELFNANAFPVDVSGWQIDDSEGGSSPYTIPAGTSIAAGGFLLVERSFGFNNDGDSVRLLGPDGVVRDSHSYTSNPGVGVAWSRFPDGSGPWQTGSTSSPNGPNPPPPTATPTATPSPTSTITPTPTPIPGGVALNEYMAAPAFGDEYVELFNTNPFPIDLTGWQIDDIEGGSSPYTIPAGTSIAAGGFLLVERSFGFNNDGDSVRLLGPDGSVRDSHSYDSNPGVGVAWSRYPDGSGPWQTGSASSPNGPNPPPPTATPTATPSPTSTITPTPTPIPGGVALNEYMVAPAAGDEYVELFNTNPFPIDLTGWQIDDIEGGSSPYTIPAGTSITAGGFLLVERSFGFNNDGDSVRLLGRMAACAIAILMTRIPALAWPGHAIRMAPASGIPILKPAPAIPIPRRLRPRPRHLPPRPQLRSLPGFC